uniref:RHOMBOID-like protein n=1 Tax=Ananas comosus var. bracteatus TaxID=296719 RepID=A0A6V7QY88_ANACO
MSFDHLHLATRCGCSHIYQYDKPSPYWNLTNKNLGLVLKIGLLYVIFGFGGSLLFALFIQSNIYVGALGALFDLLRAILSELTMNLTIYANKVAVLYMLSTGTIDKAFRYSHG